MDKESSFDKKVRQSILALHPQIKEVRNLKCIKVMTYTDEHLENVLAKIQTKRIEEVEAIPVDIHEKTFADLIVMKFSNEKGELFLATVYDNDDLWQDPDVMEIYKM